MSSAQDRVFNTPELLIHILRRVHGGHIGSKNYRKSDLLRLWQARRVSKLFYDCVLETFAQKHVKWTTVILELGQFATRSSGNEGRPRIIDDPSPAGCWEIDESHDESEVEYTHSDKETGRLTVEYVFQGWQQERQNTGWDVGQKMYAIFRPKDGILPSDAGLCLQRIRKLVENTSIYPHTGIIIWDLCHDMRLPDLCLVGEDGSISFDWRALLRIFFCLEREVRSVKTRKIHRWQRFGEMAFRPIYRIKHLSETDLDMAGMSETDNERRTYFRRLHLIRSNRVSRKRSGHKYVKRMLAAQRKGTQLERPYVGDPGYEARQLDDKATRRSLRHLHRARNPRLCHDQPDSDMPPGETCIEHLCCQPLAPQIPREAQLQKNHPYNRWNVQEISVNGWPPLRDTWERSRIPTRYHMEKNEDADDEMSDCDHETLECPPDPILEYNGDNPFLTLWRWSDRCRRDALIRIAQGPSWGAFSEYGSWHEIWRKAVGLVEHKPGKLS